jgi:D-Tyr-tRNAtyr deacylase
MRLIIQRVLSAGVRVSGEYVAQIGPGIVIFLGIHTEDNE